ncbi:MAG: filamentous hemagglutinin N-terminal domain-containing protein [Nitrospiraceae bacterium]|nr:MAG: filamentous hemagglutinin N-terminal domain-containing protein [Nitrospiraceae bacterium]
MNMLKGFIDKMLRVILCLLVLLPDFVLAAQPGVYSGKSAAPNINLPNKTGPGVTIPGFSGGMRTFNGPSAHALPELNNIERGAETPGIQGNKMTINQTEEKAIINWKTFDIGADSEVRFDQKGNADWAALNRIWDKDPSYILGKLTADGKIYLINQNGILFGPGSRINVGSLAASALNIKDEDFIGNVLKFKHENYRKEIDDTATLDPNAFVSNHGEINAKDGGQVFLLGPFTENAGVINTPAGQIGLIAGTDADLVHNNNRVAYYVIVKQAGSGYSVNQEGGRLYADGGLAGMYGGAVDQMGTIRSMTAFKNNKGEVELRAAGKVTTGKNSEISLPVNPSTTETVSDTFIIQPEVTIKGLDILDPEGSISETSAGSIELRGAVTAPAGNVVLKAGQRVYLEAGSRIDVSGVEAYLPPSILSDFKLTSVELRDAYGQKSGLVPGMKITTPVTSGTAIGDLSQVYLSGERTALERSIGGALRKEKDDKTGTWKWKSQTGMIDITVNAGDIIIKEGALLDFSGGAARYAEGFINSTKLVSGKKIYDISSAPLNIRYDKTIGQYEKVFERFGTKDSYYGLYYGGASPLQTHVPSQLKGGDAGTLRLKAATVYLDGRLDGSVMRGIHQNLVTTDRGSEEYAISAARGLEAPKAGTFILGDIDTYNEALSSQPSSILILSETSPHSGITPDSSLPEKQPTVLSAKTLNDAKLDTIQLAALETVQTAQGAGITLQPGGAFEIDTRRIEHRGKIKAPAGTIRMLIRENLTSPTDYNGNLKEEGSFVPLQERIVLGQGSMLDVSGERIDNTHAGKAGNTDFRYGLTGGGVIEILDETDLGDGVFIQAGAIADVSGGYSIDPGGKVKGANAGALTIQGSNIMLDGDLRGYALADGSGKISGGSITLTSTEIRVGSEGNDWSGFNAASGGLYKDDLNSGTLLLAGDRFDDTGFTNITLKSYGDIVIDPDIAISTSLVRLNAPVSALQAANVAGAEVPVRPDLLRLSESTAYMAGTSSFKGTAGSDFTGATGYNQGNLRQHDIDVDQAGITVSERASVRTAPGGEITFSGSGKAKTSVTIAGTLEARGGAINLKGEGNSADMIIKSTARILAGGYNRPDPSTTPKGFEVNYQPVKAGSVTLTGYNVTLEEGSIIDISGSERIENRIRAADGSIITFQEAGDPGSLTLNYINAMDWMGDVKTGVNMAGIKRAALAISRQNENNPLVVRAEDIVRYKDLGFDDLTLRSWKSLRFSGPMNVALNRKLTLDAPEIEGPGSNGVTLEAPWIVLANSYYPVTQTPGVSGVTGDALINLKGTWVDVIGTVQFTGFKDVHIEARRDIRLSQASYKLSGKAGEALVKPGKLVTAGDMIFKADRIYPGNFYTYQDTLGTIYPNIYSDYTLHADGKITILPSDTRTGGPIYSAGGNLTVEAGTGIEHRGTLAAPLGTITLTTAVIDEDPYHDDNPLTTAAGSRIYLAGGSVLTTAGDTEVLYDAINSNNIWVTEDKKKPGQFDAADDTNIVTLPFGQETLPQKGIELEADETIVREGAKIDASGGGSFFAYRFLPGIEGTGNPLEKSGRYIVFKDNGFQMPGTSVYLKGGGGLSEGMYTMVPLGPGNAQNARYAFMPGAYILELQAGPSIPGPWLVSKYGYPLVVGYAGVADTTILGTRPQVYSVRSASDVMTEGHFDKQGMIAGNAGDLTVKGNTTIIDGDLNAGPLASIYRGGKISLSGKNISVEQMTGSLLPGGFGYETSFDSTAYLMDLKDKLTIDARGLSNREFREVELGYLNPDTPQDKLNTESIIFESGTYLEAAGISVSARDNITIMEGTSERPTTLYARTEKDKDSGEGVLTLNTPGSLSAGPDSLLHAAHNIIFEVNKVDEIQGALQVDNSAITLKSRAITFTEARKTSNDAGLFLNKKLLQAFSQFEDMTFIAGYSDVATEIRFMDAYDLIAAESITMDAARIIGDNGPGVTLAAPAVTLTNSGDRTDASSTAGHDTEAGIFAVNASEQVTVGSGDILLGGFRTIALNSAGDVVFKGKGSLATGNADLEITAARVTTGAAHEAGGTYQPPDFRVIAGAGKNDLNPANLIRMMRPDNGQAATTGVPGGTLEFAARKIELGTVLQVDGGDIKLTTAGAKGEDGKFLAPSDEDGIILKDGGSIIARGTDDAPGGRVVLATNFIDETGQEQSGKIELQNGSLIDVSAGAQGDAGIITLSAPVGGVMIYGDVKGAAGKKKDKSIGRGGSLVVDTNKFAKEIIEFSTLISKVEEGGFTASLDLRARSGDIDIDNGEMLKAHKIKLTADGGAINVDGIIDASAYEGSYYPDGGTVELYAQDDLNLDGSILAGGINGGEGGYVQLSSSEGDVIVNAEEINVSGSEGGIVYLRARRNDSEGFRDVAISLNHSVTGASALYVEAVRRYGYDGFNFTSALDDAHAHYANAPVERLSNKVDADTTSFHYLPGIEVVSIGDINWNTQWDVSGVRFGGEQEPGVLTLRAGGNLYINNNLVDHPTSLANLPGSAGRDSWAFNLVAGSYTVGAAPLAVVHGKGDLKIADQKVVYTEHAPVRFASGRDTLVGRGQDTPLGFMIDPTMRYNLASPYGDIQGDIGRDLIINGGAIQTATGDIAIDIGRDLQLNTAIVSGLSTLGAIRTTGMLRTDDTTDVDPPYDDPSSKPKPMLADKDNYFNTPNSNTLTYYWRYADGGNITLDVGRHVGTISNGEWTSAMPPATNAWDYFTPILKPGGSTRNNTVLEKYGWFSASYARQSVYTLSSPKEKKQFDTTSGLAAMGGGDLYIRTGSDFLTQAGAFGEGDLAIYAGGNVDGRLLNRMGQGEIHAMGNFGSADKSQQIELFDSRMSVAAEGAMKIGSVLNPSLASDQLNQYYWINCTYTQYTGISLKAGEDLTFAGVSPLYTPTGHDISKFAKILPANVEIKAGGNILLLSDDLTLTSSPDGRLRLDAGVDIVQAVRTASSYSGKAAGITMSDIAPKYWYGLFRVYKDLVSNGGLTWNTERTLYNHHGYFKPEDAVLQALASPLHSGDTREIGISAGRDIRNLGLYAAKKTEIRAGRDILDMTYEGQNISTGDVTMIKAGRDIRMQYEKKSKTGGLIQGGPGVFLVQAGNSIDLGTSNNAVVDQKLIYGGLQAIGNGNNVLLGTEKSTLVVLSGYDQNLPADMIRTFFDDIRDAGDQYAELLSEGKSAEAAELRETTRDATIKPLLGTPSGEGNINMIASQIGTSIGQSDIFVIAAGSMNLGKTALPIAGQKSDDFTGVWTGGGGAINIFTGYDVNVNESRIMTFYGGDITIWSDEGNINAGRGSRTAVSASPARMEEYPAGSGIYRKVFSPPVLGSGIRAVTFDPDGSGPLAMPEPGDIHLTAPSGVIDAGEAGITGGKIILAALEVKNSANISFSAGSVGVPQASTSGAALGGLTGGAGSVAQPGQMAGDATPGIAAERTAQAAQMIDDILMKWLDVKVIDLVQEEEEE